MAVAVKTSPGPKSSKAPSSPALGSLIGVVYVVVCLALLFKVIPTAFWSGWEALGLHNYVIQGGALLLGLSFLVGGVLLYIGAQLSGERAPVGVRAGTFVGLCGVFLILLLTRWASVWFEHWAFTDALTSFNAAVYTGVFGGALLAIGLVALFTRPVQDAIVAFEEAGWFTPAAYKGNQGQLVRRGTVFGILLLAGAGIYTLLLDNTLRRYGPDLTLDIPFTGKIALESYGDGTRMLEQQVPVAYFPLVEVRYPGKTKWRPGQQVSLDVYSARMNELLGSLELGAKQKKAAEEAIAHLKSDPANPVQAITGINQVFYQGIENALDDGFNPDTAARIRTLERDTGIADMTRLVEFAKREAAAAKTAVPLGAELDLPIVVLLVDRFALHELDTKSVVITEQGDGPYAAGVVLTRKQFDKTREELGAQATLPEGRDRGDDKLVSITFPGGSAWKSGDLVAEKVFDTTREDLKENDQAVPLASEAYMPSGPARYDKLVLMPAIQYTVPLLLILLALWFAWRAVNLPVFADFLIATEAELNKVSWTPQKRLIQDTIVVLVTVFMMGLFLFFVDWGWKTALQLVSVLHIPKEKTATKIEKKTW